MKNLAIVLSLVLILALAACGSPAPIAAPAQEAPTAEPAAQQPAAEAPAAEPVTVSLWFHSGRGEERDALNETLKSFAAERSDIIVNAVELPEGSYNDQVQAAAFANDLPCLLDFDGPFVHN
jgi:multiple sugar transport system substrate-binding protein